MINQPKTWAECAADGMTLEQAAEARGRNVDAAQCWATRNGVTFGKQPDLSLLAGTMLERMIKVAEIESRLAAQRDRRPYRRCGLPIEPGIQEGQRMTDDVARKIERLLLTVGPMTMAEIGRRLVTSHNTTRLAIHRGKEQGKMHYRRPTAGTAGAYVAGRA
jgi:hypothetical protein